MAEGWARNQFWVVNQPLRGSLLILAISEKDAVPAGKEEAKEA